MKVLNFYIETKDYKFLYAEAEDIVCELEEKLAESRNMCDALREKVARNEYKIARMTLDAQEMKTETEDLHLLLSHKNTSFRERLQEMAERLKFVEVKAEAYDRYIEKKRKRDKRYRDKIKASKR